jgi:hypothetical protein
MRYLFATFVLLCFVAQVVLIAFAHTPTIDLRIGVPLQIVAFYALGLGVVSKSNIFNKSSTLAEEMTSPNLFIFLNGNRRLMNILRFAVGIGIMTKHQ